ncbi:MAG: DUF4160 domain-containing protein [Deltaproteobacteria bacterium]|nr:DUF4160 domain-containing protein [Deltaproteobacteria bacterium]
MPLVVDFHGIRIYIHPFDHAPPHVHVYKADREAVIDLQTLGVLEGDLPHETLKRAKEWMRKRKPEIWIRWEMAQKGERFEPIKE